MRVRKLARNTVGLAVLTALAVGMVLCGCGQKVTEEIPIGEYASLTGDTAEFGISTHNGILLAVEETNAKGGVLNKKIRLYTEDDRSEPTEAVTAVSKLINQNGVVAVLGEVASSRSLAAAPICQQSRIPMISPSSTNIEVTRKGDYIFRICFIDPFQGYVMAKFARETLKLDRVAILQDEKQDYSVGLASEFAKTFARMGGKVVKEASFATGDTDFRPQLTAIKAADPQGVYVPAYYQAVALIARQARELGITVPLMGGDGWDAPGLVRIAGKAVEGCYFSNHYSVDSENPVSKRFVDAYSKRFKEKPNALAALGYDAANILFDAMRRAGTTEGGALRDAIAATKNYPGVTGSITIDKDRNAVKPAVVLQIRNGKHVYVETIRPE
ncbi:MAG: ABC transporter substrate-binding protein [Armatimonadota bacterium]